MKLTTNYSNAKLAFEAAYVKIKAGKQVKLYKTDGVWYTQTI